MFKRNHQAAHFLRGKSVSKSMMQKRCWNFRFATCGSAQAYGPHLLIKRLDDDEPTVVARLTGLGRYRYGAAFPTHNGRWEPLPGTGAIEEMADVVTFLTPYLQPDS